MADSAGTKDKDTQDGNVRRGEFKNSFHALQFKNSVPVDKSLMFCKQNKQTSTPGVNQEGDTQTEDVDEEESEMSVAVPAGDVSEHGIIEYVCSVNLEPFPVIKVGIIWT